MVAGNQPLSAKTAPLYIFGEIESGNRHGAIVISAVLLASSLLVLLVLNAVQRRWGAENGH
jgi:sulfate transport system permease protein